MEIQRGQITCVALIIAVIGAGLGGFILNAKDVTATNTDYNYLTDVSGAFHGTGQDIPVDFNPRENVTGYYAKDIQTDPDYKSIVVPSINYRPSQNSQGEQVPNNYPYTNVRMSVEYYELSVEFTRAHGDEEFATYSCVLTNKTGGDHFGEKIEYSFASSLEISKKFFIDRSQFHWPDIYHWFVSSTKVEGFDHDVGCIVNLSELINRATWLADKHLSFSLAAEGTTYPTFGAMLNYSTHDTPGVPFPGTQVLVGNTTWYDFSFDDTTRVITASTETSSINVHGKDYALNDGWLAWGSVINTEDGDPDNRDYDKKILLNVTASTPDESMRYIDPNYGVAPQSTYGVTSEIVRTPVFSDQVFGDLHMVKTPYYNRLITTAKIYITIGDETSDWDYIPIVEFEYSALVQDISDNDDEETKNYIKIWQLNQDGSRLKEIFFTDMQSYHQTSRGISWYIVPGQGNFVRGTWYWGNEEGASHEHEGNWVCAIPKPISHDGKVQIKDMRVILSADTSGDTSFADEILYLTSSIGEAGTKEMVWQSDDEPPKIDPDDPYREGSPAIKTWAYVEEEKPIIYESEITYWFNGYNNSKVGQIFATKESAEDTLISTKLNLKLHVDKGNDYWVYGDAAKMSISISANKSDGMVYIGGLDKNGKETQKKQIGNCEHIYVEFSVDKDRRLTMYQCPIYQFTNFTTFEMMPGINCTDVLPDYYKTQDCKSITQMSYYVPFEKGTDPPTQTRQAHHLVTSTTILLDAGGMYIQDGELDLKSQFPQYPKSEFIINAVVHPGDSMSLVTTGEQGETVLATIGNDGVDKWIYNEQAYDWWELKVFYAGDGEGIWIGGSHLQGNHVYIQQGKYSPLDDIGALDNGNLTIRMDGVWAFSTQYYDGVTSTTTTVEFDDPGTWHWSKEEFMVVFMGILAVSATIMYFRFGFNALDLIVFGGQTAVLWVMFR